MRLLITKGLKIEFDNGTLSDEEVARQIRYDIIQVNYYCDHIVRLLCQNGVPHGCLNGKKFKEMGIPIYREVREFGDFLPLAVLVAYLSSFANILDDCMNL